MHVVLYAYAYAYVYRGQLLLQYSSSSRVLRSGIRLAGPQYRTLIALAELGHGADHAGVAEIDLTIIIIGQNYDRMQVI